MNFKAISAKILYRVWRNTPSFRHGECQHMNLRGIRKEEVAVWLQISVSTLYNRLSHPEKFTLAEINTIEKKLKLKPEEIINGET